MGARSRVTCFCRPALTRASSDGFMPLSGTRAMCRVGMMLCALPLLRAILTAAEMYQLEGHCKRRACDDSVDELEPPPGCRRASLGPARRVRSRQDTTGQA